MKKIIFFLMTIIVCTPSIAQKDSVNIKIRLVTESVDNEDSVYISGNHKELGNWQPDKIRLNQTDDSTFSREFLFEKDESIEFKFTKGSWNREALDDSGNVPPNHSWSAEKDTSLTYRVKTWGDRSSIPIEGQVTGLVDYMENIKTRDELLPRNIIIWLPPGYNENLDKSYPVLYMHDGQNIVDPQTSYLGVDWQIDETADSLIREGVIEPIIIVGLTSTDNRSIEYSENDTGYAYINFMADDLKPIIDKKYRTKPGRENTAVAGSSMGGLISFMAAWERPEVFSKAACLSPAFKIQSYDFVDNVRNYTGEKKDILLYIDNGGVGLEDSLQAGINEMISALEEKGYEKNKDYVWYRDTEAEHNEAAWAERTWRFLKLFFKREN